MIEKSVGRSIPDTTNIEWKLKGIAQILKCLGETPNAAFTENQNAMHFLAKSLDELSDDLFSTMSEARQGER
jgi:hypothetical protein